MESVVTLPVGRQWFGCYATSASGAGLRLITSTGADWTYRDTGLPENRPLTLVLSAPEVHACLPLGGTVLVRQRGVEHRLEPGRFGLFAGAEPVTATHSAHCRVLGLAS